MTTLFEWADRREADHRAVKARLAYWEARPGAPADLIAKFRAADAVMTAGGECPLRRASVLTVLDALAGVASLIPTAVGPNRPTRRSPLELAAGFLDPEARVPAALAADSHLRFAALKQRLKF